MRGYFVQKKLISKQFGILKLVKLDAYGNLLITNDAGLQVKMAFSKWSQQIPQTHEKCLEYVGCDVCIVTSQTTAPWSTDNYFCDIKLNKIKAVS